jgi:hypothetical protein
MAARKREGRVQKEKRGPSVSDTGNVDRDARARERFQRMVRSLFARAGRLLPVTSSRVEENEKGDDI